jgi:ankyrin repeat protein
MLANDDTGHMLLHYAPLLWIIQILERLWYWAKEQQTPKELNNIDRQTAWNLAAAKLEALGKLCECSNEELTAQESSNKLLLNKDDKERTAWHVAAKMGNVSVIKKLWEWAKERQTTEELKQILLLAKNVKGRTAWHDAAETNNRKVLDVPWEWGKEELTTKELSNKLLLAKTISKRFLALGRNDG